MKTIAFSIDSATLEELDRYTARRVEGATSRSEVIRNALRSYLGQRRRKEREQREGRIFAEKKARIDHQAAALVREQAEP